MCLHVDGLATYSCAALHTALLAADLQIGFTPPVGRRSPGSTVAAHVRGGGEMGKQGRGQGDSLDTRKQADKGTILSSTLPIPAPPPFPRQKKNICKLVLLFLSAIRN